jgi:hypothetical protein
MRQRFTSGFFNKIAMLFVYIMKNNSIETGFNILLYPINMLAFIGWIGIIF